MCGNDGSAFEEHVITDLHDIARLLHKLDAELEEFRPLLAIFRPRNGTPPSDLQLAGMARSLRKARRNHD